jgi:hypothetical protein
MGSLFKFNSPMTMTPNLPISLLLLRTITMKMLLHHIYFLHPAAAFRYGKSFLPFPLGICK